MFISIFRPAITLLFVLVTTNALAQEVPNDLVSKVIIQLFQNHNTKFLCLNEDSSLPKIRSIVEAKLKDLGGDSSANQNIIASVLYTEFPCPFSPNRKGLRLASAKDVEGVWLFPEASQKLRFGPNSPSWQSQAAMPIKCEGVAYYEGGEARVAQAAGNNPCPFSSAKSMDPARANPIVSKWTMLREGRLKIDRTDVQNHVEEWDVYVVESPFQAGKTLFNPGDLVAYMRKAKGNDLNVATTFRHLQKLP